MRVLGVIGTTMILSFMWLDSFVLMCAAVFVQIDADSEAALFSSERPLTLVHRQERHSRHMRESRRVE